MIRFEIFHIRVAVSVGFAGLIAFMLYVDTTGLMLLSLEAVALHEAGHLVAMRLLGCRQDCIVLRLGAVNIGGNVDTSLRDELWIALAGPLCNLVFAQVLLLANYVYPLPALLRLGCVMLIVGLFHLLPVQGLDGGTILYCLLAGRFGGRAANRAVGVVSVVSGIGLLAMGVAVFVMGGGNPSLILLAVYLLFGILIKL